MDEVDTWMKHERTERPLFAWNPIWSLHCNLQLDRHMSSEEGVESKLKKHDSKRKCHL
jgi:hypothetical protein